MLHITFERSSLYELKGYPTTLKNNLAKPSKVKNKHMLRLCKPILLENYHIYVCVCIYIYNIYMEMCIEIHKVTLFITAKKKLETS